MPIICCPDCQKQISDRAAACLHCGCPIAVSLTKEDDKVTSHTDVQQPKQPEERTLAVTTNQSVAKDSSVAQRKCPKCRSEQIQSARVIYESGHVKTTGESIGSSIGSGFARPQGEGAAGVISAFGSMLSLSSSNSTSTTALAQRLSPPEMPKKVSGGSVGGIIMSSLFLLIFLIAVIGGIANHENGAGIFMCLIFGLISFGALIFCVKSKKNKDEFASKENDRLQKEYFLALREYNDTWFCHSCGHTFI